MGPCPNAKYPIFSQFDKKIPNQNINLKKFSVIIIIFFFHLDVLFFFIILLRVMCVSIGTPINKIISTCSNGKLIIFCVPKLRIFTA